MPNHVHILMTVPGGISLEKAMQLIKGGLFVPSSQGTAIWWRSLAAWILGHVRS
jgi:REP element-mobilizing transposase RayT